MSWTSGVRYTGHVIILLHLLQFVGAEYTDISFIAGDTFISSRLVKQGLFPCSPIFPAVAFTTRTIELFHAIHLRCPRLGKQGFIRSLCDLRSAPPHAHLQTQFTVAYDLFLRTRETIRLRVARDLGRDGPNWRLKNACPSCTFKVEGETELNPAIFVTVDGNNSLKRFGRRERIDGEKVPGSMKERLDDRVPSRDYYLPRAVVDEYEKDAGAELMKGFIPDPKYDEEGDGCGDTWQNMKEDVTAKSWGLYEETGIFLSLCRHNFVLKVCDMIRSGELAKYGLAVTADLLQVLESILAGYDIGCKFIKWAYSHPLVAPLARQHNFRTVVGAFHGCGHHRGCQCFKLPLYVKGAGLEPFEGCESWFSKSNALAGTTRYASRYHRQQEIVEYLAHADAFDAYANLSSLLSSKYRHAIEVIETLPSLEQAMKTLGVSDRSTFELWLQEEAAELKKLKTEPPEETLHMEYYQKLVNLQAAEYALLLSSFVFANFIPRATVAKVLEVDIFILPAEDSDDYAASAKRTRQLELDRRHALERRDKILVTVHDLEKRLPGFARRWKEDDEEWQTAAVLVTERRYRRALDKLQGLIISRMLELTKVNMAGTGHIAKALQARSKAVKTALIRYNEAARTLVPPRPLLTWEEVVNYAFLADFDLLRLAREDIREAAWTRAGAREAMDQHFRILRAEEERVRLNVEIRRLVTYMRDEERFLVHQEGKLEEEGEFARACQVRKLRMLQGRFSAIRMDRFMKLSKLHGFTGSILPGRSVSRDRDVPEGPVREPSMSAVEVPPLGEDDAGESGDGEPQDDTDDEEMEGLQEAFETLVRVTGDGPEASE
ncbi:hypothetical protein C8F01DRAFT_1003511 [Mycena amicta]|nr:hypothetical protein C8F01DRAFT_1003511 [Mycena amicta]